ncbi:hypothetical protein OF385_07075 [Glutamicibacter sp. JL.03c]|uniref:hypothetical protein n=1 Tax=Glutamicibacter sp. JL.03c TaxID=2984842 RepID=UPI0021F7FCDB|nr:hypothetical protein [Glutamicibacter sp. JL.03c]UYQ78893.1 hypothetical protein OF385_07075 [Glutamicibacter sp. JL.03c]
MVEAGTFGFLMAGSCAGCTTGADLAGVIGVAVFAVPVLTAGFFAGAAVAGSTALLLTGAGTGSALARAGRGPGWTATFFTALAGAADGAVLPVVLAGIFGVAGAGAAGSGIRCSGTAPWSLGSSLVLDSGALGTGFGALEEADGFAGALGVGDGSDTCEGSGLAETVAVGD